MVKIGVWLPDDKKYPPRWVDQWIFDQHDFELIVYHKTEDLSATGYQLDIFLLTDTRLWDSIYKFYNFRNITVDATTIDSAAQLDQTLRRRFPQYFEPSPYPKPIQVNLLWLGNRPPPQRYLPLIQAWSLRYQVVFWDNQMVDQLIRDKLPEYYQFYNSIQHIITKCHFARFAIVYTQGGYYFDLDYHVGTVPLDEIQDIILVPTPPEVANAISVSCFGAKAGDPYLAGWLEQMRVNLERCRRMTRGEVATTTGDQAFYRYYLHYGHNRPELSSSCSYIPYTPKGQLSSVCFKCKPEIKSFTLWNEGTGWQQEWNEGSFGFILWTVVFVILAAIIILSLVLYGKDARILGGAKQIRPGVRAPER